MELEIGNIIQGRISKIAPFGAFVELEDGRSGLIHISQIAEAYVNNVADVVCIGDLVQVKVISLENGGKKIGLSMKEAGGAIQPPPAAEHNTDTQDSESFEDRLARFMKYSNEKQLSLKKHQEIKKCR